MDCGLPGSSIHGIFQATVLEWGAIAFSILGSSAKSLQSCLTVQPNGLQPTRLLCPWDSPGKNTGVGCHFLLPCMKMKSLSRVRLLVTPWTAAHQAPPSMRFYRQEYWSGMPSPSPSCSVPLLMGGGKCARFLLTLDVQGVRGKEMKMKLGVGKK